MPWGVVSLEEKRLDFVNQVLSKQKSKSALCRDFGISRPTGDKWLLRYKNDEGLSNKSSKPLSVPNNKTEKKIEKLIVSVRDTYKAMGAKKIRKYLKDKPANKEIQLPCVSTINAILKRNGCVSKEESLKRQHYKSFQKDNSNDMWQTDFKGYIFLENKQRCYPLNVIDDYSRFNLCIDAKTNETYLSTRETFERIFKEYGLPSVLLCDNGNPWGVNYAADGYTSFEVWLMKLGVLTMHGKPHHPQTQGKVERFNGTFKREFLKFHKCRNIKDAQKQFNEFRNFYNNERGHEALSMEVPASKYTSSDKKYKSKNLDWEYKNSTRTVRKITPAGHLTYGKKLYFLGYAFRGEHVAVYETNDLHCVDVVFRNFRIARLDVDKKEVISKRAYLLDNDPRLENN